jgi:hypothetical protein
MGFLAWCSFPEYVLARCKMTHPEADKYETEHKYIMQQWMHLCNITKYRESQINIKFKTKWRYLQTNR